MRHKTRQFFKALHDRDVLEVVEAEVSKPPVEVVGLGRLVSVVYLKTGDNKHYEHEFENPLPYLVTDPGGRALFIAGGDYKVSDRGIEG